MEEQKPYGSEPINQTDNQEPEVVEEVQEEIVEPEVQPEPKEDKPNELTKLEKMLRDSQSMIGKQSSEIGQLRSRLEEMQKPKEETPDINVQIQDIVRQMDEGEISQYDGLQKALALNSQLTASQVMAQMQQQRQQEKMTEVQSSFLKNNPDYEEVVASGELQPYLDADPMADEYVAYKEWKKDQEIAALEAEYKAKIDAAKEEGAKLAKGAQKAGQVLGKQGASPQATRPNKPFKNQQEATDAMMQTLKEIRSQSA